MDFEDIGSQSTASKSRINYPQGSTRYWGKCCSAHPLLYLLPVVAWLSTNVSFFSRTEKCKALWTILCVSDFYSTSHVLCIFPCSFILHFHWCWTFSPGFLRDSPSVRKELVLLCGGLSLSKLPTLHQLCFFIIIIIYLTASLVNLWFKDCFIPPSHFSILGGWSRNPLKPERCLSLI